MHLCGDDVLGGEGEVVLRRGRRDQPWGLWRWVETLKGKQVPDNGRQ